MSNVNAVGGKMTTELTRKAQPASTVRLTVLNRLLAKIGKTNHLAGAIYMK